jgi:hypothetical protein
LEALTKQLIAVRNLIKGPQYMGKSGNHDPDVYNYIELAASKAGVLSKLGFFPIYYFLLSADACDGFDNKFAPFLVKEMAGTSHEPGVTPEPRKKRASPTNSDDGLVNVLKVMVESQSAANQMKKESAQALLQQASATAQFQERQIGIQERQLKLQEGQLLIDQRKALIEQWKDVREMVKSYRAGTPEYDVVKSMENDLLAQISACSTPAAAVSAASAAASAAAAPSTAGASAKPAATSSTKKRAARNRKQAPVATRKAGAGAARQACASSTEEADACATQEASAYATEKALPSSSSSSSSSSDDTSMLLV